MIKIVKKFPKKNSTGTNLHNLQKLVFILMSHLHEPISSVILTQTYFCTPFCFIETNRFKMQRDIRALQREIRELRHYKEENNELKNRLHAADRVNTDLQRKLDQEREEHTTDRRKFEILVAEADQTMLIMQQELRDVREQFDPQYQVDILLAERRGFARVKALIESGVHVPKPLSEVCAILEDIDAKLLRYGVTV
jgi:hypothetical protein